MIKKSSLLNIYAMSGKMKVKYSNVVGNSLKNPLKISLNLKKVLKFEYNCNIIETCKIRVKTDALFVYSI